MLTEPFPIGSRGHEVQCRATTQPLKLAASDSEQVSLHPFWGICRTRQSVMRLCLPNAVHFSCGAMPDRNDVRHDARAARTSKGNQPTAANACYTRPNSTSAVCSESPTQIHTAEVESGLQLRQRQPEASGGENSGAATISRKLDGQRLVGPSR